MGKYIQGEYPVVCKENLAAGMFSLVIHAPEIVEKVKEGQFVNIKVDGLFLRRPISICHVDREKGNLRIVFAIKGEGTKRLADLKKGDMADILAPLGNGFKLLDKNSKVILVGGGIGVPPMVSLSDYYRENATAISGFRNASLVILQKEFEKNNSNTVLCTDDGSAGIHGFVTQPLEELLSNGEYDMVYACGPKAMLKNIAAVAEKYNTECQVSLEERMGCGIGACLICACPIKTDEDTTEMLHVCKNGPVFNSKEVVW